MTRKHSSPSRRPGHGAEGKSLALKVTQAPTTSGPLRQLIDLVAARIARELIEEAQREARASAKAMPTKKANPATDKAS